jgi:BMFP domain-containing protein YqiC
MTTRFSLCVVVTCLIVCVTACSLTPPSNQYRLLILKELSTTLTKTNRAKTNLSDLDLLYKENFSSVQKAVLKTEIEKSFVLEDDLVVGLEKSTTNSSQNQDEDLLSVLTCVAPKGSLILVDTGTYDEFSVQATLFTPSTFENCQTGSKIRLSKYVVKNRVLDN